MLLHRCQIILLIACLFVSINGRSQTVEYTISWKAPNSHYLDITMSIEAPDQPTTLFRIPAWRPGRYIIQNYSRNVIGFSAEDEKGRALAFRKTDKDSWQVDSGQAKKITIRYQYYAAELDAGSSYLDETEVYVNPNNLLMYIPGKENLPCRLTVQHPPEWELACALKKDRGALLADNYHELVDSPLIAGSELTIFGFNTRGARIDIAMEGHFDGKQESVAADLQKIVETQVDLFGELPLTYYVFLYHLVPHRFMHGVEHKNSTSIVSGPANFDDPGFYRRFLSVSAHEFFHVWNVERIRPTAIYKPDYSKENYSSLMWFFEGVTSYYTRMTLYRAGLLNKGQLYRHIQQNMRRSLNNPGSLITSASASSWNSWVNSSDIPPNTSISFYRKGEFLGLMLDLDIRRRTNNRVSLDDVMRYLNIEYAKKDRGVPEDGILKAVEAVSGQDYDEFFQRYIDGTEVPDYEGIMAAAGILVADQAENLPIPYLGFEIRGSEELTISNLRNNSPAMAAGIMDDDILLAIENRRITRRNYSEILGTLSPDQIVTISVFRENMLKHFKVTVGQTPEKLILLDDVQTPGEKARTIREGWQRGTTTP